MHKTRLAYSFLGFFVALIFLPRPARAGVGVNPTSLSFGSVTVNAASSAATVVLTNDGRQTVLILQVSSSLPEFIVTSPALPMTLGPHGSASFQVMFRPDAALTFNGGIVLRIGHRGGGTQTISVSGTGTIAPSAPSQSALLSAGASTLNFGNTPVGGSTSQVVALTNTGTASLNVLQAAVTGGGFGVSGFSGSATLAAGQSLSLTVSFAPATATSATGSLSVVSSATNSPATIALSGTGVQGQLTANPSTASFGNVTVGSSGSQTITLTNGGTASVAISGGSVSGTGYSMSGLSTITLNAGKSTTFTAQFAPTTAGAATGGISITSSAPGSPLTIALGGTGTQPQLTISPTSAPFGNVAVGSSSTQNVTLTNSGSGALNITSATPSGTGFSFTGLGAQTINAGASVTVPVKFSPTSAGAATGSISISSNAPGSPATIALSGTGVQGQFTANPSAASFGSVTMGSSNSQTINLTNSGTAAVSISQATVSGAGFSTSGLPTLPMTLNAGASTTFNAVFAPTTSGTVTGSVSLVGNASNSPLGITLSGSGVAATYLLTANPTSLSFNNVDDGSNSALTVTLTNTGNSSVAISSATATGAGFSATGVAGTTLTPNQTATLTVTFAPTTAGAVSGSVTVASNATNSPTIAASGTGVQPVASPVDLTWTASVSTGVVGYNVYRGTVSGGPYGILNSSPVAVDTYSDSTVQAGQEYFYVVRSVNGSGTESANSTEVSAMIP
jgi:Abnormal spindle-like microcephaly-assoc'd, ASPM-SPD-2-Hydin